MDEHASNNITTSNKPTTAKVADVNQEEEKRQSSYAITIKLLLEG